MKTLFSCDYHKPLLHGYYAMLAVVVLHSVYSSSVAAPLSEAWCKDMQPAKFQANDIAAAVNLKSHSFTDVTVACGSQVSLSLPDDKAVTAIEVGIVSGHLENNRPIKIGAQLGDAVYEVSLQDSDERNATISISSLHSGVDHIIIQSSPPSCFKSRVWVCLQPVVQSQGNLQPVGGDPGETSLQWNGKLHMHVRKRAVERSKDSEHSTLKTYSWMHFMLVGVFSMTLLAILPALLMVAICCHGEKRKKRSQDKDLIVGESIPFDCKNNPMKARQESQKHRESKYRVDPLGVPTISTFHEQRSSIDKPPLDAPPTVSTPLEESPFCFSVSKSAVDVNLLAKPTPGSPHAHRGSTSDSEHISVSSFTPKHTPTHTGHTNVASPHSKVVQPPPSTAAAVEGPPVDDYHPAEYTTFTAIPRMKATETRQRSTDSYSSNGSGVSYILNGVRLSVLSDTSLLESSEEVITTKQTHILDIEHHNITTEGDSTVPNATTETHKDHLVSTKRGPSFTVKVYHHNPQEDNKAQSSARPSSMTTILPLPHNDEENSVLAEKTRPFSEAGAVGDTTSLDKGTRLYIPKPSKSAPHTPIATRRHDVESSKDVKKKKQHKKALKKAPLSPPHTPPPLPPLPLAPPTSDLTDVEVLTEKKRRAPTPTSARTMAVLRTPTKEYSANNLQKRLARNVAVSPPHTPPPLPPPPHTPSFLPPLPHTPPPLPPPLHTPPPLPPLPSGHQVKSSMLSTRRISDVIICSICGQEIKEDGKDSPLEVKGGDCTAESDPKVKLPLTRKKSVPPYHILKPGSAICIDCLMRDGPIYHELEAPSASETLDDPAPPIPLRDHPLPLPPPLKHKDPVYERVGSLNKTHNPASATTEENTITRSRKPKSLVIRTGSSTDYESIPSLDSSAYHKAEEVMVSQAASAFGGHGWRTLPALHFQGGKMSHNVIVEDTPVGSTHDYESLTSFMNGEQHTVVKLGAVNERRGSHDYACIGEAPSMEDLSTSPESPPFIPEGAKRVQLLKIDSQGYASVMPLEDDEIDCLTFSEEREQCVLQPAESLQCSLNDMWKYQQPADPGYAPLVPRRQSSSSSHSQANNVPSATPQDYEVPVNCLPPVEELLPPRRNSHILTRQRTLASETLVEEEPPRRSSEHLERAKFYVDDNIHSPSHYMAESDHEESEEVFDSGIENSVDPHDQIAGQTRHDDVEATISSRVGSLGDTTDTAADSVDEGFKRPRATTIHSTQIQARSHGQAKEHNRRPKSTALHISLDQTSQAVV